MADDASDYRDLMAQLEAAFSPRSQSYYGNPITGEVIPLNDENVQLSEPMRQAAIGLSDIPGSIGTYLYETAQKPDPSQRIAEDIRRVGGAIYDQAMSSPTEFAKTVGGFLPVVGEAMSAYDAKHLYADLKKAEAEGDTKKADSLRQFYGAAVAGAVPLLGVGARLAGKTARKVAHTGERAAESLVEGAGRGLEGALESSAHIPFDFGETQYVTRQDGPFYRVSKRGAEGDSGVRDFSEGVRGEAGSEPTPHGGAGEWLGGRDPSYDEERALAEIMKDPARNRPRQVLEQYIKDTFGREGLEPIDIPESSLTKQSSIGRAYALAAEERQPYKNAVFDAYRKQMPEIIEQTGASNYDELLAAAYAQLRKETAAQFERLPQDLSFYRNGEGAYANSERMLHDLHRGNHLAVFQGGEEHNFLGGIDPKIGLTANEKFRAVHDAFGHGINGYMFGPKGEERAWALHQQSYSPLAQLAMTAETRGQNSFVNYTPVNAALRDKVYDVESKMATARQYGWRDELAKLQEQKDKLLSNFQFAPNKGLLLPPEFLDPKYAGGMPDYVQKLIRPSEGTQFASDLTHYSHDPNLRTADPSRYGTGIAGDEASRIFNDKGEPRPGAVRDRSYFYLGQPGDVPAEAGLGPHAYTTRSENLYNATEDPESLALLARVANRRSPLVSFNPATTDSLRMGNDLERLAREYGYEGIVNTNAAFPMATVFKPKDVAPRVTFREKEPHQWGPQDWGDYGRMHGVENLGPVDEEQWLNSLGRLQTKSGRDVTIPGGMETTDPFTYYDLLHLKAQGINPNDLDPAHHQAIHNRMVAALQPGKGGATDAQIANQMLFGMISPNQPLTPNELALQRVMIKSPGDLEDLGNMIPYRYSDETIPSKAERNAMSRKITQMYGLQAAPEGLGVSGSANYTDLAEFAQKMKDRPDFFRFNPDDPSLAGMSDSEKWATHVGRVLNEVRGLKAKTASLASVWQDPENAAISAIDRHMATKFRSEMFPNRKEARAWEKETIADFNNGKAKKERVKTIDDLLEAPGGRGHFVDRALAYVNNLPSSTMRIKKTGEYNPAVPKGLRDVNWVGKEPEKVQVVSGPYVRALEANQAEADKAGQSLFANQWMLWDRIRNRLEPHEILFPGLEKLPRMNLEQMKAVQRAHADRGYLAAEGAVRPEPNPSRLGYFAVPIAGGAVGSELARRYSGDQSGEQGYANGGLVGGNDGAQEAANLDTLFEKYADPGYAIGGPVTDDQIKGLYERYAGRTADEAGLGYWKDQAAKGTSYADLSNAFQKAAADPAAQAQAKAMIDSGQVHTVEAPAWLKPFDYEKYDNPLDAGYNYLKNTLGDKAASALYGNFYTESGINPQQLQTNKGPNSPPLFDKMTNMPLGMGLAQWEPARQEKLYNFAEKYGLDPNSTEGQLRFVVNNLTTDPYYAKFYNRLKNPAVDVNSATQIMGRGYEAPFNLAATIAERQANAALFSKYFGGGVLTPAEQQKIAGIKQGIKDPLFEQKMLQRQTLVNNNDANRKFKGDTGMIEDVNFNPITNTSVNDQIMQQSNDWQNQQIQNNLNYNWLDPNLMSTNLLTTNTSQPMFSSSGTQGIGGDYNITPGANTQLSVSTDFPSWYQPYADGGSVGSNSVYDPDEIDAIAARIRGAK